MKQVKIQRCVHSFFVTKNKLVICQAFFEETPGVWTRRTVGVLWVIVCRIAMVEARKHSLFHFSGSGMAPDCSCIVNAQLLIVFAVSLPYPLPPKVSPLLLQSATTLRNAAPILLPTWFRHSSFSITTPGP